MEDLPFKSRGFDQYLDAGYDSTVYASSTKPGRVLKVFSDDCFASYLWLEAMIDMQGNPNIPVIYDVEFDGQYWFVEMELLIGQCHEAAKTIRLIQNDWIDGNLKAVMDRVYNIIEMYDNDEVVYDLHSANNIMFRDDTPVIIDPIVSHR